MYLIQQEYMGSASEMKKQTSHRDVQKILRISYDAYPQFSPTLLVFSLAWLAHSPEDCEICPV